MRGTGTRAKIATYRWIDKTKTCSEKEADENKISVCRTLPRR